jgi:hypothetical protein
MTISLPKPIQDIRSVINKRIDRNKDGIKTCAFVRELNIKHEYMDTINEKKDKVCNSQLNIGSINHPRGIIYLYFFAL